MAKINRRDFLKLSGLSAAFLALSACKPGLSIPLERTPIPTLPIIGTPTIPGSTPTGSPQALPAQNDIALLLRRITYGVSAQDLDHAMKIGFDNFIDEQIHFSSIPDPDLDIHLSGLESLQRSPEELRTVGQKGVPITDLVRSTLLRAVYSKHQLFELMVDFWSNHFNIDVRKGNVAYLKIQDDRDVIRKNALGKFSDLLKASAQSPAMLIYLDNYVSTKTSPNENYARELLELHTLGVDGGYTQTDVHEVARALTGWGTGGAAKNFGQFLFNPANHDKEAKKILGVDFPAGKGIEDGNKVLDLLANHPSTARFIATKLVRRFVSDEPPAGLVSRAAETFTKTGGEISATLSTILHSAEFRASLGAKQKRPFEWIVSAIRAVGAQTTVDKATVGFLDAMGQPLFRWPTPDGFPDQASAWNTSNDLLTRWNFSLALAFNTLKDSPIELSQTTFDRPEVWIDQFSRTVFGKTLSSESANIIVEYAKTAAKQSALPGTVALLLSAPDFQYR